MAARDLSVITTQSILIDTNWFCEELIQDAISYEIQRNGQVFFINNPLRIEVAGMIQRLVPMRGGIGHGQMEGKNSKS
jgi:transcription-repair coupling factor (superfamily II helicase)